MSVVVVSNIYVCIYMWYGPAKLSKYSYACHYFIILYLLPILDGFPATLDPCPEFGVVLS